MTIGAPPEKGRRLLGGGLCLCDLAGSQLTSGTDLLFRKGSAVLQFAKSLEPPLTLS
jgi:hypothetical protein